MRTQILTVLLSLPALLYGQTAGPGEHASNVPARGAAQANLTPSFRSQAELVVLHVAVRDKHGQHVTGLSPDAFRIFEDNRSQPVSVFTHHADPVTVGLILDVSGSMTANRNRLIFAASQFAQGGHPEDEIFALLVGDTARPVLPADAPFTSDGVVLHQSIARNLKPGGRTALYDAIRDGLAYLARGTHERRALVVLSDGLDNASDTTFDEVLFRTQSSNAAIYAVGLVDPIRLERHPRHLRRLARASGGEVYFPDNHADSYDAMAAVARDIRNAYAIGFAPRDTAGDGKYHRLQVTVTAPDGRRLDVRAREGYTAGSQDGSD